MNNKVNILVVDDRPEGILAVQAVLDSPAYNLVSASSGTEALRWLLQDDFAVILLDVQMPIMNGFETAAVVKTREKSKDIPIIFMSAINQDEQYVYQGYNVGAVDYLLKPFDPHILKSKVAIFVDLYRKNLLIKEQTRKIYESELKTYSQALDRLELESLRRYQYLADALPHLVCRFLPEASATYFNKTWYDYTGLDPARSLEFGWKDSVHPEDLESMLELLKSDKKECEARIRDKNGRFRWHLLRVEPEKYDSLDIVSSYLLTAIDIEERKKSEETQRFLAKAGELLVSSLDYEQTLGDIARLIVPELADWCAFDILDIDGHLQNIALVHRSPEQEPLARELHQHYLIQSDSQVGAGRVVVTNASEIYPEITQDILNAYIKDERHMEIAHQLGERSALIVPISTQSKVFGAITLVFSDSGRTYDNHYKNVSEELARRAAMAYENSRLYKLSQQAIEIRNDFLSIASHELNTPITSLKLQLQMLQKVMEKAVDNDFPVAQFERSIKSSVKQVDRLINLVQVLLDVSRIQSGKFNFVFRQVNVGEMLLEVVDRQRDLIESAGCTLEFVNAVNLTAVWDKTRVEQLVINLLTNAVKYAPGKIVMRVTPVGEGVELIIQDFGEGIPDQKLATIFERFERANVDEKVGGLGLGLFIVKQIVEGHQGVIQVSSKPAQGTTFTVFLPLDASVAYQADRHVEAVTH